ncbi:MAG: HAMP domain-containing methyl-accepting chemotaxis protein, partial [Candidatus Omnitrophota bacterium]
VFIASYASKGIADPIRMLAGAAKGVAGGDLTSSIDVKSADEIGTLADSFRMMTKNLNSVISNMRNAVSQIMSASSEILAASQQQAAGAREQSAAVSETTSAARELSKSAEQVGDSIKRVSEVATHALVGMAKIKEAIGKTGEIITSLSEKSQKIGKITEVIDDVADQTNLLAVNAAIEAARAGEQGRGFTVVADEIRKLADSTAKSTKDITALIEIIQHEMSNAIMSMETSVNSVDEESKLAQESADRSKEISMSTAQQVAGSKQIADAMVNIDEAMKQVAIGAQQSQVAVKQLTELGKELNIMSENFKIK